MTQTLPALAAATADPALLARLDAHARQAAGAFADNTKAAYASDTRIFAAWCTERGLAALPALPATIAAFVADMAASRKPATVTRYVASIAAMHKAAAVDDLPTRHQMVTLALRTMRRAHGTAQKQAPGLGRGDLDRILAVLDQTQLSALRDAALVALMYDTLLRRAEVVALDLEDVQEAGDGTGTVRVRRSKGDQEGAGDDVRFIAADTMDRLTAYRQAAGLDAGALFRVVAKGGRISRRLDAGDINRILARRAKQAGLACTPTGHSLRVGAASDLAHAGAELPGIMLAGGWKSPTMPARYTRRANVRRGAMARLAVMQGRA